MVLVLVRNKALGMYAAETNKVFLTGLARLVQIYLQQIKKEHHFGAPYCKV
jgi:hypothetical protein